MSVCCVKPVALLANTYFTIGISNVCLVLHSVINDMMAPASKDSLRSNMGAITVPSLVLWGQHDKVQPAAVVTMFIFT